MTIKGKDLIEHIKDKEYSKELIKELEKYEIKRAKSVWELKRGDECWLTVYKYSTDNFVSNSSQWYYGWRAHEHLREIGKVHLTKERAELHARVLNTELAIKKWKRENDNVEWDWNRNQVKHCLFYDVENEEIRINWWRTLKFVNTIYFSSNSKAQQCIDDIGEERIIEWIKWEDNDE